MPYERNIYNLLLFLFFSSILVSNFLAFLSYQNVTFSVQLAAFPKKTESELNTKNIQEGERHRFYSWTGLV